MIENEIEGCSQKLKHAEGGPGGPLVRAQSFRCSSSVQSLVGELNPISCSVQPKNKVKCTEKEVIKLCEG